MPVSIILLILVLIIYTSLLFNTYVLLSLFLKNTPERKPINIGFSAIIALLIMIIFFNVKLFNSETSIGFVGYGFLTGLCSGIYRESKRSLNAKTVVDSNLKAETAINKFSFRRKGAFTVAIRLLLCSAAGIAGIFLFAGLMKFLFETSFI